MAGTELDQTPTASGSRHRLIVRGSINIDEFFQVPHIVLSGETISSTGYSKRAGGKGANQAVSAAKAGGHVDFVGAIGNDGNWLREALADYGVGVDRLLRLDDEPTGRALIQLSTSTSDNSIVLLPGSNASLSPSLSPTATSLTPYSHLFLQNEIPLISTLEWLYAAKQDGVEVVLNPSPMLSKKEQESFPWSKVDWLLVNEGEAKELLGETSQEEEGDESYIKALGKKYEGINLVITKGGDGLTALFKGDLIPCAAGKVQGGVKDTTGAGDCFTGYFATLLSSHPPNTSADLKKILEIASQAAAMCVESEGAMESVPLVEKVKERMNTSWPAWE